MRSSPTDVLDPGEPRVFVCSFIIFYIKRNQIKNTNAIYFFQLHHLQPPQSLDTVPLN
jgi:hypothetical protein